MNAHASGFVSKGEFRWRWWVFRWRSQEDDRRAVTQHKYVYARVKNLTYVYQTNKRSLSIRLYLIFIPKPMLPK